jgi:ATP-dependent RNA helicase DDX1
LKFQFDDYGEPFGKGDYIGCYLDLDRMEISFSKNGVHLGRAFAIAKSQEKQPFFPAIVLKVKLVSLL